MVHGVTNECGEEIVNPAETTGANVDPPAAEDGRDFRRRLLDGFEQSIRERGLRQTQINDIVRIARTSKRTFYECFADREACFAELIDEWGRKTLDAVAAAVDRDAPWDRQVDSTVDAYLGFVAVNPVLAVTVSRELPTLGARGAKLQEEDVDRFALLVMELSRGPGAVRAGMDPVDLITARMLIGGVAEVLDRAIREGDPLESVAATVKTVIKRVIGPRSADGAREPRFNS
jgi:AcrR family transcriptional regulator